MLLIGLRLKKNIKFTKITVQSLNNIIGIHCVISEPCYKGTILQRNYKKMTIPFHGHFPVISSKIQCSIGEPQHDRVISKSMVCYKETAL